MISKKQYLKALDTVKKYEEQLRIGVVVCSADDNKETVTLDDTWYNVEINDVNTTMNGKFEFGDVVNILLTPTQRELFINDYTNREFRVSKKRINKMFTFLKGKNNPWRRNT